MIDLTASGSVSGNLWILSVRSVTLLYKDRFLVYDAETETDSWVYISIFEIFHYGNANSLYFCLCLSNTLSSLQYHIQFT